jgi:hypothetical protein
VFEFNGEEEKIREGETEKIQIKIKLEGN